MLERLEAYAERFRPHFNRSRQALWGGVYLRGLLLEGERKSIEPLSRQVSLPATLSAVADPEQALQQFVNQSHWDEAAVAREYRATMAEALADPDGVFVVNDTTFPKAGAIRWACSASTAGRWAKRPIANAPSPCITWRRAVIAR